MSDVYKCHVDQTEHATIEALHAHLRKFRIKQEDYYKNFFPKKDLLTGEDIPFKSVEHYLSAHFANKINMRQYFKQRPEDGKQLALTLLKDRIERKKLKKLPTEIELISCGLPSSSYYYRSLAEEIKQLPLKTPYNYEVTDLILSNDPFSIIVDTREKTPLNFKGVVSKVGTLHFGDYAIEGKENNIVVERKSLPDFVTSFVTHFERIKREFQRAKDAGAYLVVVCEESFNTAQNYSYIPHFKKYIKVRSEVVFHSVRELIQEFDCQFVFADGRVAAADLVLKIFKMGDKVKTLDLQYLVDRTQIL